VYDMVERLLGEQEAAKRLVLTADSVPQDEIGLRQLIVRCLTFLLMTVICLILVRLEKIQSVINILAVVKAAASLPWGIR